MDNDKDNDECDIGESKMFQLLLDSGESNAKPTVIQVCVPNSAKDILNALEAQATEFTRTTHKTTKNWTEKALTELFHDEMREEQEEKDQGKSYTGDFAIQPNLLNNILKEDSGVCKEQKSCTSVWLTASTEHGHQESQLCTSEGLTALSECDGLSVLTKKLDSQLNKSDRLTASTECDGWTASSEHRQLELQLNTSDRLTASTEELKKCKLPENETCTHSDMCKPTDLPLNTYREKCRRLDEAKQCFPLKTWCVKKRKRRKIDFRTLYAKCRLQGDETENNEAELMPGVLNDFCRDLMPDQINDPSDKVDFDTLYSRCRLQDQVMLHRLGDLNTMAAGLAQMKKEVGDNDDNTGLSEAGSDTTGAYISQDLPTCFHCNGTGKASRPPLVSIQVQTTESRLESPAVVVNPDHSVCNQGNIINISLDSENTTEDDEESTFRKSGTCLELNDAPQNTVLIEIENPVDMEQDNPVDIMLENPLDIAVENPVHIEIKNTNETENPAQMETLCMKSNNALTYRLWRMAVGNTVNRLISPLLRGKQFICPLCNEAVCLKTLVDSQKLSKIQQHLSRHLYYDIREDKICVVDTEMTLKPSEKMCRRKETCQQDDKNCLRKSLCPPYGKVRLQTLIENQKYIEKVIGEISEQEKDIEPESSKKSNTAVILNLDCVPPMSSAEPPLSSNEPLGLHAALTGNSSEVSQELLTNFETTLAAVSSLAREVRGEMLLIQDGCFYTDLIQPEDFVWPCNICNIGFIEQHDMNLHAMSIHQNVLAEIASKTSEKKKTKKKYVYPKYVYPKPGPCRICGNVYSNMQKLNYHMKLHENKAAYQCNVCNKNFNCPKSLKAHKRLHINGKHDFCRKRVVCEICGKTLSSGNMLRAHRKRFHPNSTIEPKSYLCSKCPKTFENLSGLRIHNSRIHQPPLGINDDNGMKKWRAWDKPDINCSEVTLDGGADL